MAGGNPVPRPPRPSLAEAALRQPPLLTPSSSLWAPLAWTSWIVTAVFALGWLFLAVIQNSYRSMNEGWSQAQGDRLIYLPMLGPAAAAVLVLLVVLITPARRWGLRATVALAGLGAVLGWLSELADWLFLTAR